jgi:propane 2-monooxygenase large subunit
VPSAKFMASAASSRIQSPNVLLNQMSREERGEYVAKYKRGGPGGRPAAA